MKKAFKFYLVIWAILFVTFHIVLIALPKEMTIGGVTFTKLGGSSWIALVLMEICFLGNLFFTTVALRQNKLSGTFYRLPIIGLAFGSVIVTTVIGCIAMAIPNIPSWIPPIAMLLVMAFYAAAVMTAAAAAKIAEGVDEKITVKTSFVRDLAIDADTLITRAKSEPVKTACKKVYEAVRYSDPLSGDTLHDVEARIRTEFDGLTDAVLSDDADAANAAADELLSLIRERNQKCKAEK